jgi:hypothetical protein
MYNQTMDNQTAKNNYMNRDGESYSGQMAKSGGSAGRGESIGGLGKKKSTKNLLV